MWSKFNYNKLPTVYVEFEGVIHNDDEYKYFINEWKKLNFNKQPFEFIFNTKNCGMVNLKYAIHMAMFIRELKKDKQNSYLTKSTIMVYNKYIYNLLKLIFDIEKPIAPVYLLYYENTQNSPKKYETILPI